MSTSSSSSFRACNRVSLLLDTAYVRMRQREQKNLGNILRVGQLQVGGQMGQIGEDQSVFYFRASPRELPDELLEEMTSSATRVKGEEDLVGRGCKLQVVGYGEEFVPLLRMAKEVLHQV